MSPQYLTMIGLGFDIVGGFLLAVEAIKIENLRVLRDRVLKRLNSYILGPRMVPTRNIFVDTIGKVQDKEYRLESSQNKERIESLPAMGCLPLLALHVLVGLITIILFVKCIDSNIYTKLSSFLSELSLLSKLLVILLITIIGIPLSGAIGSGVFTALSFTINSIIKVIDFIDAKTPTGTIGIMGFFFLALGFLFQLVATYLSI